MKHPKDKHHRKTRSRGGTDAPRNISVVPQHLHRAYHLLFGNMTPRELAKMLTDTWIDPDFYLVAIPRKKSRRKTFMQDGKKYLQIIVEIPKNGKVNMQKVKKNFYQATFERKRK